ncbi:PRC-barrel domain-containing protein [Tardiphaga sp. OK245]|uniref:PRC-barrel domain-containing protein n=1 Tax=Tardiphaga sp. OK245 TaxID=1855306 RepID=UPI0008A801C6|nr:PRC-barrel domain-containing protein [Tardiphaga sp. OK245]SEI19932.1 PRC-barrel domain-containing protein [Tardiphaga sp. OK245]
MTPDVMTKPHSLIASDRIEGTAVRRPNGERIGHIERLMIDKISGKVSYAILSFGGFLGLGSNLLPLPWARLTFNRTLDAYQLEYQRRGIAQRAVIHRETRVRLGRQVAGRSAASPLRRRTLLGRILTTNFGGTGTVIVPPRWFWTTHNDRRNICSRNT